MSETPVDPLREIRVSRLQDQGQENDLAGTTPEQRVLMMWQLAKDAYAMLGYSGEPNFQRDIVRVIRGKS